MIRTLRAAGILVVLSCSAVACAPSRGAAYEKALAEASRAHHAGRFDVAAERFDEAARTAKVPRDAVRARFEAALARARHGDVARASKELHAIADAHPRNAYSASAAYKAADLAWKSDPVAGYAELEAVVLRFHEDTAAKVALARILRHDDEDGPAKTLAHLEALAPKLTKTALEGDVAYQRAKRLAEVGRVEAARDAFLDVARRWPYPGGPYFDDALYRASEMEEKLGRYHEAIEHLERLLSFRESSVMIGSYERPRYVPALLRIVKLYDERLNDRAKARETLHRLYADFKTSTLRDDALWREAALWLKDGDNETACKRLSTLASDFPDSRYVPCAVERCSSIKRPSKSKAPKTCHPYLTREATPHDPEEPTPTVDTARPDDPK
ncbi:MAG TPA: tetratricopeptide repeat protein [Labilithrix sp.]|nr:tetratricopeptide repeat protein [Labilithrix sp.]